MRAWSPGRTHGARRAGRLAVFDLAILLAVGAVVVLVSLPSLRRFALAENEEDALRLVTLVGPELEGLAPGERPSLAAFLRERPELARRLDDWQPCGDGRVRRHGYLFEIIARPSGSHAPLAGLEPGGPCLRAWPWRHGETGLGAFIWCSKAGLVGHANRAGAFSGEDGAPSWPPMGQVAAGSGPESWRLLRAD